MLSLSREKLAEIVQGKFLPSTEKFSFTGVEYDSRQIKGGELFIALKGEKTHGHEFLEQALSNGAALALVEDSSLLEDHLEAQRLVCVADTLRSFSQLASYWRRELGLPVLAITGSVGKTTVKEMCASILLRKSRGNYSLKSHNNHVGVPYTILRTGREHAWLVLEMGMNHAGELNTLSKMASPDVALINSVTFAHIEFFSSIAEIADAKFEIKNGLGAQGALAINADDAEIQHALHRHPISANQKLYKFGLAEKAQVRLLKVKSLGLEGIQVELSVFGEPLEFSMNVVGRQNAMNAAAAVLASKLLVPQMTLQEIKAGLESFTAPLMRLNLKHLADGKQIIDDSYNANPASMRSALELAADLSSQGKRVGLLLGDMLELGSYSEKLHSEVGEQAAGCGAKFVIAVGRLSEQLLAPARARGIPAFKADSAQDAAEQVRKLQFDVLLVKASRGVQLDQAVQILTKVN